MIIIGICTHNSVIRFDQRFRRVVLIYLLVFFAIVSKIRINKFYKMKYLTNLKIDLSFIFPPNEQIPF